MDTQRPPVSASAVERRQRRPRLRSLIVAIGAASLLTLGVEEVGSAAPGAIPINDGSFKCLKQMTRVRHFFVDNLLGNREGTIEVAKMGTGTYPPGSGVQLVPGEVMVKQQKGFSAATNDWEFFELDVSKDGSKIRKRGFADVNNRFGGNCFACHVKARKEFDSICELEHGCEGIPITRRMLAAVQKTDERCSDPDKLTDDDKKALDELTEVLKTMKMPSGPPKT